MEKVDFQVDIANRFLQIRRNLYGDNNRKMALLIGEDERVVSAICTGKRAPGLTTLLKLLNQNPQVDANWLLVGRIPNSSMPVHEVQTKEESLVPLDVVSLEKYEKKVEECALLRAELNTLKAQAARYAAEKGVYSGTTIPTEV